MTFEQILAKLDEIALEVAAVKPCAVCHRSHFLSELTECGSCGALLCPKCDRQMQSSSPNSIRSQNHAA